MRIKEIKAFIADNPDGEGIVSMMVGGEHMPLVFSTDKMVNLVKPMVLDIARKTQRKITLASFSVREDLEEIK